MSSVVTTHSLAQLEQAADLFGVLAETSRLQLLSVLQSGQRSVSELVEATGLKQGNVSKQLGILHRARLVERQREGLFTRYRIADPVVFELCRLVCSKQRRDAEAFLSEISG